MIWKPDLCIYHFPCDDGFGSALAVWMKWGDDVEFCPMNYGQEPPNVIGRDVLIVDFSFKAKVLNEMGADAKSIVILDHHKTAMDDLDNFKVDIHLTHDNVQEVLNNENPVIAEFDMTRSGAVMTYQFCFEGPVPELFLRLQDRDLWKMALPNSRAFSLYLRSFPHEFSAWEEIGNDLTKQRVRERMMEHAQAIERYYDRQISQMCDTAVETNIGGHHQVPVVNCSNVFSSDVAHELLKRYRGAPFAACFHVTGYQRLFSLRSEDRRIDVSEVAKMFGGGGHRNAAGFKLPFDISAVQTGEQ